MNDIALPLPGHAPTTPLKLYLVAFTIFAILAALNASLVRSKSEDKCDTRGGPFSSGFGSGFQTYSCECSSPFHFAEACPTPAMLLPPDFAPAL
jgi:hypothetical protein